MPHRPFLLTAACVAALSSACGGDDLSSEEQCYVGNMELTLEPSTIIRGEAVELTVVWNLDYPVYDWGYVPSEPAAVFLYAGVDDEIEVEVPLSEAGGGYEGALLNPFGPGAPVGAGWVLAQGPVYEVCPVPPTGTLTFELQ